jgi:hypothetical protein
MRFLYLLIHKKKTFFPSLHPEREGSKWIDQVEEEEDDVNK